MISYSAVILDDKSRENLINRFKKYILNDWEVIAHHMTINTKEITPEWENYLGMDVNLTVESIAMDDMVVAVGVSGFYSENKKPHITLAVNRKNGGKPFMSKNLENWRKIKPITIKGKVTEVIL